jgi:hypothetical protein
MLGSPHRDNVFGDYEEQYSAKTVDPDVGITASIRHHHPDMTLSVTPTSYADLLDFAAAGYARAELDTADDSILRWRLCVSAPTRGNPGTLQDATFFARYKYEWKNLSFTVYRCQEGSENITYILFPPDVSFQSITCNPPATNKAGRRNRPLQLQSNRRAPERDCGRQAVRHRAHDPSL